MNNNGFVSSYESARYYPVRTPFCIIPRKAFSNDNFVILPNRDGVHICSLLQYFWNACTLRSEEDDVFFNVDLFGMYLGSVELY